MASSPQANPCCPRCRQPVAAPDSGDDLAAFLQQEGDACRALANALASLRSHDGTVNGVTVGIGGYGSMGPEVEEWAKQMWNERQRLEREIAELRARLYHDPGP